MKLIWTFVRIKELVLHVKVLQNFGKQNFEKKVHSSYYRGSNYSESTVFIKEFLSFL